LTHSTSYENDNLKLKTKLNYDSEKNLDKELNKRNIVFIFNILHRFIKLYNEEISVIDGNEYEHIEDKGHRTIFLATNYKKKLNLFFYNPHGTQVFYQFIIISKKYLIQVKQKKLMEKR